MKSKPTNSYILCFKKSFYKRKKNPAKQAAGRFSDIIPFRRSAILAKRFGFIGHNFIRNQKNAWINKIFQAFSIWFNNYFIKFNQIICDLYFFIISFEFNAFIICTVLNLSLPQQIFLSSHLHLRSVQAYLQYYINKEFKRIFLSNFLLFCRINTPELQDV